MKVINVAYVKERNYPLAMTGRTYAYKSEINLDSGDIIFVPTGKNNDLRRAIVVSVEPDKDFPFPVKEIGIETVLYTLKTLSEEVIEIDKEEKEEVEKEESTYFQI